MCERANDGVIGLSYPALSRISPLLRLPVLHFAPTECVQALESFSFIFFFFLRKILSYIEKSKRKVIFK